MASASGDCAQRAAANLDLAGDVSTITHEISRERSRVRGRRHRLMWALVSYICRWMKRPNRSALESAGLVADGDM